jgi:hypothetical protein
VHCRLGYTLEGMLKSELPTDVTPPQIKHHKHPQNNNLTFTFSKHEEHHGPTQTEKARQYWEDHVKSANEEKIARQHHPRHAGDSSSSSAAAVGAGFGNGASEDGPINLGGGGVAAVIVESATSSSPGAPTKTPQRHPNENISPSLSSASLPVD